MEKLNDAQRKVIEDNYNLIFHIYFKYFASMIDAEEYRGIAEEAICKAALDHDPKKGAFGTHLYWKIKGELTNYFDTLNRQKRQADKIAISLETPLKEFEDLKIGDWLVDGKDSIDTVVEMAHWKKVLKQQSKDRQRIIALKLLGYNNCEIGKIMGITHQRVSSQVKTFKKAMGYL